MTAKLNLTTIQPTAASALFVTINQRSKEGEAEKPKLYVEFSLPEVLESIANTEVKAFAMRAYAEAVRQAANTARKDGLDNFTMPAIGELFSISNKREFLLTKKDVQKWLDDFAYAIIQAAISAKGNLNPDSPKVIKKTNQYQEILLGLTSRQIMTQADIDNCLRVCELLANSGKDHPYTDNVVQGIARAQKKLDDFLSNGSNDLDDDLDF